MPPLTAGSDDKSMTATRGSGVEPTLAPSAPPPALPGLNAFVDLSHHNTTVDLPRARAGGLVGMIHKATQGVNFLDPAFAGRVAQARELGLLVGAYHFCTAEPVERQVAFFLATLDRTGREGVLPCIDWEPNPIAGQGTMKLSGLLAFIESFHSATGLYPVIYGGYWLLGQLSGPQPPAVLQRCPLWQGFYSAAFGYLSDIWDRWTFVQYTNGQAGPEPRTFPGLGPVDRNLFNGTLDEAKAFWQTHALKA